VAGAAFSTTTGKKCSATIPVAYKFTKSLKIGMKDAEVKTLQQFLNNSGFTVAVSGSGSKGNETTYFGPATQKALISYQKSKGIVPAAGYFGPLTIASITGVTINSNTIPASTYAKSVYTVPTSVPAPFTSSKKSASASGSVGLGSSGDTVKTLRTRLRDQGYLPEYGVSGAPASASLETGYFNAETEAALKKFQCDWHIVCTGSPDTTGWGVLGERTIQKFNSL
jgi:peptidoglycan hydrolase-like protein with peptidoglycan-binding domain